MRFLLYLLLFIVIVVFGLTFSLQNAGSVELRYYPDLVVTAPLAIVLLATLFIGALIGFLAAFLVVLRKQRELVRTRRQVKKLDQEVQNLRNAPYKEPA